MTFNIPSEKDECLLAQLKVRCEFDDDFGRHLSKDPHLKTVTKALST